MSTAAILIISGVIALYLIVTLFILAINTPKERRWWINNAPQRMWINNPYNKHYHQAVEILETFKTQYLCRLSSGETVMVNREDVTDEMF